MPFMLISEPPATFPRSFKLFWSLFSLNVFMEFVFKKVFCVWRIKAEEFESVAAGFVQGFG